VNLGYSPEVCSNITAYDKEEVAVQKKVSELKIYNSLLQAVPSVLFTLFAGPWSDKWEEHIIIKQSELSTTVLNITETRYNVFLDACIENITS